MKRSKHQSNTLPSLLLILVLMISASYISYKYEKPNINISKQQSTLNLDDKFYQLFNLGQKRFISSLLWITTILESDHEHYKAKDLNSWMYLRFLTISNLEPNFLPTYNFGGPYLSIIKDDLTGASLIYNKGLIFYPDNYELLYNAGFHFFFEVKNYERAFPIFKKLSLQTKLPLFVVSSLARLESKNGNLEDAKVLFDNYQSNHSLDTLIGQKIYEYRYSLKSEIDLKCLNKSSKIDNECNLKDLDGNLYILDKGVFSAPKKWNPLRIK